MRKLVVLITGIIFLSGSIMTVRADDFDQIGKIKYEFSPDGSASITNEISIINNTDRYFVSEYSVNLSGGNYQNVEAYDSIGKLNISVNQEGDHTLIKIQFNDQVVGVGKIQSFILKYKSKNLAQQSGSNWEIKLPRVIDQPSYRDFQLEMVVPKSFGIPSNLSPQPDDINENNNSISYLYKDQDLSTIGVIALMGDSQIYDVSIKYFLQNTTGIKTIQEIPIPPDTPYQKVFINLIDPSPDNTFRDEDDNWIASYDLLPAENKEITLSSRIQIFNKPRNSQNKSKDELIKYTQKTQYWDTNNIKIQELAKTLKTPENIYRYVMNYLSYDYNEVKENRPRLGSNLAINNPTKSVCSEYTDLFIAIARAAGIPSRELEGFAFNDNEQLKKLYLENDVLHSWPEYFDSQKSNWVAVDPTFEDTSGGIDYFKNFDNSHITFVIHGLNDSYPIPPGGYKNTGIREKQIKVTALTNRELPNSKTIDYKILNSDPLQLTINRINQQLEERFSFNLLNPSNLYVFSLLNNNLSINLLNTSGYPIDLEKVKSSDNLNFIIGENPVILPYGSATVRAVLKPEELLKNYNLNSSLSIYDQTNKLNFRVISSTLVTFYIFSVLGIIIFYYLIKGIIKRKGETIEDENNF